MSSSEHSSAPAGRFLGIPIPAAPRRCLHLDVQLLDLSQIEDIAAAARARGLHIELRRHPSCEVLRVDGDRETMSVYADRGALAHIDTTPLDVAVEFDAPEARPSAEVRMQGEMGESLTRATPVAGLFSGSAGTKTLLDETLGASGDLEMCCQCGDWFPRPVELHHPGDKCEADIGRRAREADSQLERAAEAGLTSEAFARSTDGAA